MGGPYRDQGSILLVDELFDAGDPRFLEELLHQRTGNLAAMAPRLHGDRRPFARRALLEYIEDGCDRPRHRPLVKRLFKLAEGSGDDEAMGHFLVAFDHFFRREVVAGRARVVPPDRSRLGREPGTGEAVKVEGGAKDRFSSATRRYLQRRAWRYFRFLGFRDPPRYGRAIRAALVRHEDRHLATPEELLGSWGLVHALFHGSPAVRRLSSGAVFARDHDLADLAPAPFRPQTWLGVRDELIDLAEHARSRTVRTATLAWLRERYAGELTGVPVARVRSLLRSPHDEVVLLGLELLRGADGLERLPIEDWLELLRLEKPALLPTIVALVDQHVAPSRVTLPVCLELAASRFAPVAELAFRWLRAGRAVPLDELVRLAGAAEVAAVRDQAVTWALPRVDAAEGKAEQLRELLDSRHADVRRRALTHMDAGERWGDDRTLWAALPESPYPEVQDHLALRLGGAAARLPAGSLSHVWATALLAVHRGGRARPRVVRQLAEQIVAEPARAPQLLPLLAIALRTLRLPDRRSALVALVGAAERRPDLAAAIRAALPELEILDDAATARASTGAR